MRTASYLECDDEADENQRGARVLHALLEVVRLHCVDASEEDDYGGEDDECEEEALQQDAH